MSLSEEFEKFLKSFLNYLEVACPSRAGGLGDVVEAQGESGLEASRIGR